jgi:hypothetical protein
MAGAAGQPSPRAGTIEDLIQPVRRQRHAAPRAPEHHEHPVRASLRGGLGVQVGADLGKEPADTGTMRWWPPLPSAMNSRRSPKRRSPSRSPRTSQRRSPPSTIAATIARSRCVRSARAARRPRPHRGSAAASGAPAPTGRPDQAAAIPAWSAGPEAPG